jgi:hypothetical protein
LIQVPTSADCHLSRLRIADFRVDRRFLDKLAKYKREHAEEIAAFWDRLDGTDP